MGLFVNIPTWPIMRLVAFVLFVIGAVIAIFVNQDPETMWGLIFAGLAAYSLS